MLKASLVLCFLAALGGAQGVNISCNQPTDVMFLLDNSESISPVNFEKMITFVKEQVARYNIGLTDTRIAAITFSRSAYLEFALGAYNTLAEVEHAFDQVRRGKWRDTMTYAGLNYARFRMTSFGRREVPRILITITDGVSNNRTETARVANMTRQAGIEIFVIGVGSLDKVQLKEIASEPFSDHLFTVTGFPQLSSISGLVRQKTCLDTDPTDKPSDQAAAEKACHQKPAEVVFVLDMSSSIFMLDFKKQLAFVSNLVKLFDIGRNKTRVAVVSFSTNATVEFHLDEFYEQKGVRDHVETILYTGGGTNTDDALKLVKNSVLTPKHGVRSNVPHVVIVITDGRSHNSSDTRAQAEALKNSGIFMFAIGVGPYVDDQELEAIASAPSENFMFKITGYDELLSIKSTLALRACEAGSRSGRQIDAE
ncbi:cartilage matrix protein [Aplysia californica]|uniref:Cartilage matrix protein n=1 Tax=Aplysia californica TaxID=6500 RepID=A0ABM0JNR0_APLCA|nr:cartilage matrix protein [Aplysia californica]